MTDVVDAVVVRGDGRGRTLGFPTANLGIKSGVVPAPGVYAVSVDGEGLSQAPAVCNVGVRPTISDSIGVHVEVHIPGYMGDLYGKRLRVRFIRRIREEKKFASLAELKAQIAADVASLH